MKEINDAASKYYEKPVKVQFRAESPIVLSAEDDSVIASGDNVPLEIIQLAEMSRCLHSMIYEFESKKLRRGTPPEYGRFSIREIVEATGAEWLPGDGDIYFTRHAEIPLANGKRLYLRQGDDPEDRECRVLDDAPKLQSGNPLWDGLVDQLGLSGKEMARLREDLQGTKFKVQIETVNGWADIKASINGGPYEVELFDSHAAALADVGDELDPDEFRVVPEGTKEDCNLY